MREQCAGAPGACGHTGTGRQVSRRTLGRSAAACRYRPCAGDATQDHALRRAHVGSGPGDDQGSAGSNERTGFFTADDHRGNHATSWALPAKWPTASLCSTKARSSKTCRLLSSSIIHATNGCGASCHRYSSNCPAIGLEIQHLAGYRAENLGRRRSDSAQNNGNSCKPNAADNRYSQAKVDCRSRRKGGMGA